MNESKYENVSNDFIEIISGTNNIYAQEYLEAKKEVDNGTSKSMIQLKNFYIDIEKTYKELGNKKADKQIRSSKGDINKFSGYENMKYAFDLLSKPLADSVLMRNLITIKRSLENNKSIYVDAYNKKVRLVALEYENSLYILQMGLCALFANCVELIGTEPGYKVNASAKISNKLIIKTIDKTASELKDDKHKKYLNGIMQAAEKSPRKMNESTETDEYIIEDTNYNEANISDSQIQKFPYIGGFLAIIQNLGSLFGGLKTMFISIKQSLFGIIPLIRSIIYLRYKRKADTILALEMNIALIKENIEILKRVKTKSDAEKKEIIKKQQAIAEQYSKKIEKLKAELGATEYEAAKALKAKEPELKKTDNTSSNGNDDFVLENTNMNDIFDEIEKINKK